MFSFASGVSSTVDIYYIYIWAFLPSLAVRPKRLGPRGATWTSPRHAEAPPPTGGSGSGIGRGPVRWSTAWDRSTDSSASERDMEPLEPDKTYRDIPL